MYAFLSGDRKGVSKKAPRYAGGRPGHKSDLCGRNLRGCRRADNNGDVEFEESHPVEIGGDFGYYKRFDTGITVSAGVEFKQYQIKFNYARGFTDFTNSEFVKSYNSIINISGAYFFGRNY